MSKHWPIHVWLSQALGQCFGHIADHLRVERWTRFKVCPQRVDHAGICLGSIENGGDETRVVLRLGEDAINAFLPNPALDLGNPRRAWIRRVAERDRAGGREIERDLEILIGVVEDDEVASTNRIESLVHLRRQDFQLGPAGRGVGKVSARIFGVCRRELRGNQVQPHAGVFWREPSMRIVVAMGVTVIIMGHFLMVAFVLVLVCVLFVVVVMPFLIVGMLVMFIMLVVLIVGMFVMFIMFVVWVRLEQSPFPEFEQEGDVRFQKRRDRRIPSQVFHRVCHPGCQVLTHPKHKIGILKRCRLGRTQAVFVGGGARRHDQVWRTDTLHYACHERMHRRDVDRNTWNIRHGGATHHRCGEREGKKLSGHSILHVIM